MLAKWIISHFPKHRIYVEPFGGAASVLLQKMPVYSEIYNDLDNEVVNLFRVVRDHGEELKALLINTPFARMELKDAYNTSLNPIESARRMMVRSFMGFGSAAASGQVTGFRSGSHRSGTTPAKDWNNYPEALAGIIKRLRLVTIENKDAKEIMAQHDSKSTLHYIDPPYVLDTRYRGQATSCYKFEMSNDEHWALCEFIKTLEGFVILSGYDHPIYNTALANWHRVERKTFADGAKARTEVLWINRMEEASQGRFVFDQIETIQ